MVNRVVFEEPKTFSKMPWPHPSSGTLKAAAGRVHRQVQLYPRGEIARRPASGRDTGFNR
jgi:hypothetical protein